MGLVLSKLSGAKGYLNYASGIQDPDVKNFINATGITDDTQRKAINNLVFDLKIYNIWTKQKALYPVIGGTEARHAVNLKTPGTYNLTFSSGWTHASTGMTPVTAYADTNLVPSVDLVGQQNNQHMSFYSRTNAAAATTVEIGTSGNPSTGNNGSLIITRNADNSFYGRINSLTNTTVGNTNSTGFYITSRISSTTQSIYRNGIGTSGASTSTGLSINSINIGRWNNPGGTLYYSNKQCAFASIGDGLTDTEAANFYIAVQKFQTTLGRQV